MQVQVHPCAGLTFAVALRAFLRADPDVMVVGESRELEIAVIAGEASLAGHQVLSTLHTINTPSLLLLPAPRSGPARRASASDR
jgi:type IV pilus assembly protein PilB